MTINQVLHIQPIALNERF